MLKHKLHVTHKVGLFCLNVKSLFETVHSNKLNKRFCWNLHARIGGLKLILNKNASEIKSNIPIKSRQLATFIRRPVGKTSWENCSRRSIVSVISFEIAASCRL